MPSPKTKNELDSKKLLLSLFFLFSAFGLFWLALQDEQALSENDLIPVQASDEAVRKHLRKTSQKIEAQKVRAQIDNFAPAPRFSEGSTQVYEASSHGLEFKPDPRLNELSHTLGRQPKASGNQVPDPKEVVQNQLYEQQKWNEYKLAYRQAYAQQFIENARKNGWDIRLNEEFKIVKVKAIKKDNRPQLFTGSNGRAPDSESAEAPK